MLKYLSPSPIATIDILDEVVWKGLVVIEASVICPIDVIVGLSEHILIMHCVVHWAYSVKE